jgi:hypothetical protein
MEDATADSCVREAAVRLRPHRRAMVVWSSSSGRAARHGVQETTRSARRGRIRWWLRIGALLTVIGVLRLGRTARTRLRPTISLAGAAITVVGISLPSKTVLVSGFLVLLVALFMPSDPASAPAKPCSARLWAASCTPFSPSARHLPPNSRP